MIFRNHAASWGARSLETDAMLLENEKGDDISPDTIYNLLTDLSMNSQNTLNIKTAHAGPG